MVALLDGADLTVDTTGPVGMNNLNFVLAHKAGTLHLDGRKTP
jgi:hypothetical protein